MKLQGWLFIIACFVVSSCQHNDVHEETTLKEYNKNEAASFNTQLGLAYLKQGNQPRAKKKLLAALSQDPDSPSVNAAMAYYMEKTGNLNEANTYYQKAMSLAPNSGAQLNNYGAYLCRLGRYKQAEEYFARAVKDIRYENTAGAYENAGLCALAIPDEIKAKHYFIKALEQDSSRKQSLYELTKIDIKQNNPNEALQYLQKYSTLTLRNVTLLSLAADVAHKAGKVKLEADYNERLQQLTNFSDNTGVKHEYINNG